MRNNIFRLEAGISWKNIGGDIVQSFKRNFDKMLAKFIPVIQVGIFKCKCNIQPIRWVQRYMYVTISTRLT